MSEHVRCHREATEITAGQAVRSVVRRIEWPASPVVHLGNDTFESPDRGMRIVLGKDYAELSFGGLSMFPRY